MNAFNKPKSKHRTHIKHLYLKYDKIFFCYNNVKIVIKLPEKVLSLLVLFKSVVL